MSEEVQNVKTNGAILLGGKEDNSGLRAILNCGTDKKII
jgi:hypothetical protein